jgi:nitrate reductase (cytochrome), electron transfer subunit
MRPDAENPLNRTKRKEATMDKSMKLLLAAAFGAGLVACATTTVPFAGVSTLRGADASSLDKAPETVLAYAGKRPGSGAPIDRTFKEQPPLIPHAIDNFDEITGTDNQCMECHSPATFTAKNAPKVGDSHLAGKELVMSRYQCNSCHVPQVDAKPLVANSFVGTTPAPRKP